MKKNWMYILAIIALGVAVYLVTHFNEVNKTVKPPDLPEVYKGSQ